MSTALQRTRTHASTLGIVLVLELGLAWSFGLAVAQRLGRSLQTHPDGTAALTLDGGRLAFDLLRTQTTTVGLGLILAAALTALYALASIPLGGALPIALASPTRIPPSSAFTQSLRRSPALLLLALLAALGYLTALAFAWLTLRLGAPARADILAPNTALVLTLLSLSPATLLALLVRVWHDLARLHLLTANTGTLSAARTAVQALRTRPIALLGAYLLCLFAIATIVLSTILLEDSLGTIGTLSTLATIVLTPISTGTQLLARATWLAYLAISQASWPTR